MQDDISSIKYDDKTPKIKMIEGKTCHSLGWFQLWRQIIHNDYYELQMQCWTIWYVSYNGFINESVLYGLNFMEKLHL